MKKLEKKIIQAVKEEVIKLREKDSGYYTVEDNQILLTAVVNGKVYICFVLNKKTGTIIKEGYLYEKIKEKIGEKDS